MAPRPRSYPALAALLWIAFAICSLSAPAGAHTPAGDYETATFGTAPDPWGSVVPAEELLADTEDDATGDNLSPAFRAYICGTAFRPLTGHEWRGSLPRFLIPFETGPPAA